MLTIVFLARRRSADRLRRFRRDPARGPAAEATRKDGWKQTMSEILEADLTSLDSVAHGFAGR